MNSYIVKRIVLFIPTLILASILIFVIMRSLPGDVVTVILSGSGEGVVSLEAKEALREELGLDKPLIKQYLTWAKSFITGEFGGRSLENREQISSIIYRQAPVPLLLTFYSLVISICISTPLGIYSALRKGSIADIFTRLTSLIGLAFPNMWMALIIILLLLLLFGWSPPIIYSSPGSDIWLHIQIVIWPALIIGWEQSSHMIRVVRSNMLDILGKDYIVTARSKGLPELSIIMGHAVPNVLIPTLTMTGLQIGSLITGVVVLETIFGLPGLGRGLIQAALVRDYPVIQTIVTVIIMISLFINLLVDILYKKADPRLYELD